VLVFHAADRLGEHGRDAVSQVLSAPGQRFLACPSGESRPTALLRSLDDPACAAERDNRRKIDSLARRAAGRLRSLGRVGRKFETV
jgi:hypothetical protein